MDAWPRPWDALIGSLAEVVGWCLEFRPRSWLQPAFKSSFQESAISPASWTIRRRKKRWKVLSQYVCASVAEHSKLGNLCGIEIYSVLKVKSKVLVGSLFQGLCSMTLNPLERANSRRILLRPFSENPIPSRHDLVSIKGPTSLHHIGSNWILEEIS